MGSIYEVAVGGTIPVVFGIVDSENYIGKLDAIIEKITPGQMLAGNVSALPCIHVRAGTVTGHFTTSLYHESGKLVMELQDKIYPESPIYFDSSVEW